MTHPTWELNVSDNSAALVLTPCPGTQGLDLKSSLEQLKESGVTAIVTAINNEEMVKVGVTEIGEIAKSLGMDWYHQPIEDHCAPGDGFDKRWGKVSPAIQTTLDKGEKVAVHCMGGSGRTGMLAAHILLDRSWKIEDIKSQVKSLRPRAFSQQVQIDYINKVAGK